MLLLGVSVVKAFALFITFEATVVRGVTNYFQPPQKGNGILK